MHWGRYPLDETKPTLKKVRKQKMYFGRKAELHEQIAVLEAKQKTLHLNMKNKEKDFEIKTKESESEARIEKKELESILKLEAQQKLAQMKTDSDKKIAELENSHAKAMQDKEFKYKKEIEELKTKQATDLANVKVEKTEELHKKLQNQDNNNTKFVQDMSMKFMEKPALPAKQTIDVSTTTVNKDK